MIIKARDLVGKRFILGRNEASNAYSNYVETVCWIQPNKNYNHEFELVSEISNGRCYGCLASTEIEVQKLLPKDDYPELYI